MSLLRPVVAAIVLLFCLCLQTPATAQTSPVWGQKKVKNYLPHMTRTDMVIIPVGAVESPPAGLPAGDLMDVWGESDDRVYAVGTNGVILRCAPGG